MTTYKALSINPDKFIFAKRSLVTLSGVVRLKGVGVKRILQIFKEMDNTAIGTTSSSEVDGSWSFSLTAAPHSRLRVICIGESGENSAVFDFIAQ